MTDLITAQTDTGELRFIPTRRYELRFEGLLTIHRVEYVVSGFAEWSWPHDETPEDGEWIVMSVYTNRPWGDPKGGQTATPAAIKVLQDELPDIIKYAVADHTELFYEAEEERRRMDRSTLERQLDKARIDVDVLSTELHNLRTGQKYDPFPTEEG